MTVSGLDEKAPKKQNAQNHENGDNYDLDQAHSEILNIPAGQWPKTSADKRIDILRRATATVNENGP